MSVKCPRVLECVSHSACETLISRDARHLKALGLDSANGIAYSKRRMFLEHLSRLVAFCSALPRWLLGAPFPSRDGRKS